MKGIQHIKSGISNENIEFIDTKSKETIEAWKGMWKNSIERFRYYKHELNKLRDENHHLKELMKKIKANER